MSTYNPFARRESHDRFSLGTYRVLVPLSWLLVVVVGIYYSSHAPDVKHGHTIWKQANKHITPFSLSTVISGVYWIITLLSQIGFVYHLFSNDAVTATAAANVGSHFILNNLFIFAWILLWTRNHFWGSEIILIAHFLNQKTTYWRHRTLPPLAHFAAVAAPYAWTLITLFWNGAVAVNSNSLPARIVANVFIWVLFALGSTHILSTQDDILGYSLSLLTLALAVKQFGVKIISLQWIFAIVIFAVFFAESLYISLTKYSGRNIFFRRAGQPAPVTDREREPLLNDSTQPAQTA
ncbi:DUF1774 domain-containing protein [Aspergillus luchuensis]|uniref:ATP synthase F0 n=3 Tax=Aspergillus subgen. Circumdati TaxID=2720871 RepID=A0A1L9NKV6_ASPTC|nr:ATP synthase F0 [Aspergillus costaricaensis CBS 115574]XP_041542837.1 uncharacterized protein AKAW2_40757S [Aspergillus luchuensis]OJI89861.1 hypothetical protein ASPTUDRAFT_195372 [Aspergillus tubingensis CBS 134.48]GAA87208.1 ATP synthase F0 [Aspergillus luchuensis IFO 4308]RAK85720.1 ATP synthase F0 [Aspergillus costaricaensis CBS 115574]BCR99074.1 hypothetical protein AKAW2_40757S [Aspergillus luchuensis]BCS11384.1 hypothetical protein ALUC_40724S [Aspergillus luchuensis]